MATKPRLTRADEALVRMALQHVLLRGLDTIRAKQLAEEWAQSVKNEPRYAQPAKLAAQVAALMLAGW